MRGWWWLFFLILAALTSVGLWIGPTMLQAWEREPFEERAMARLFRYPYPWEGIYAADIMADRLKGMSHQEIDRFLQAQAWPQKSNKSFAPKIEQELRRTAGGL